MIFNNNQNARLAVNQTGRGTDVAQDLSHAHNSTNDGSGSNQGSQLPEPSEKEILMFCWEYEENDPISDPAWVTTPWGELYTEYHNLCGQMIDTARWEWLMQAIGARGGDPARFASKVFSLKGNQGTIESTAGNMPAVPEDVRAVELLGVDACPWLDDYIAFSRHWSPRGFDDFHEACGLWILSTIAGRRVGFHFGKLRHTGLYIAFVARSSMFNKTTTVEIAISMIQKAGLSALLAADDSTPQKFISDLTLRPIDNYQAMSPEDQTKSLTRMAFHGKRGWFYEEFGQKISSMMKDGGVMADFRGILRRFDDGAESYEYASLSRGTDRIDRPYLSLLVNMTPADLRPFAARGASLWGDGFLARFALITPPESEPSKERFPSGERIIPHNLTSPLVDWHRRLGVPETVLEDLPDQEGRPTHSKRVRVGPAKTSILSLDPDVIEAFYQYDAALRRIIYLTRKEDLDGNYARFPEKALRIAALLASVGGSDRIELKHWGRAQAIVERWRAGLHELYNQLNVPQPTQETENEERVLEVIQRKGKLTKREIGQLTHFESRKVGSILSNLVSSGIVAEEHSGKTNYYSLLP